MGIVVEFALPTPDSYAQGIAAGPDGNLWFAEYNGNRIGRLVPPAPRLLLPMAPHAGGL